MKLWLAASILLTVSSTQSIVTDGDHAVYLEKVKKVYASAIVNTSYSPWSVDEEFLSISLSPKRVIGSGALPWYLSRLQMLARNLSPAWLRIGGEETNYVTFESNQTSNFSVPIEQEQPLPDGSQPVNLRMLPIEWDRVNKFAQRVGWKVLFGLNVQQRNSGVWDPANAASLISYTAEKEYYTSWSLGNNPTEFGSLPNTTSVAPDDLAQDFLLLKRLLYLWPYVGKLVTGPDVTLGNYSSDSMRYLQEFLETGMNFSTGGVVDAITWHQYYFNGQTASLKDFISPNVMDTLLDKITMIRSATKNYTTPVWIGETASSSQDSASWVSKTFAAGFLFLDKLGMAAASNVSVVMKETLVGGNTGLLTADFRPLPLYWLSLLHKYLVGTRVLSVQNGLKYGRNLRVYAHCANIRSQPNYYFPTYSSGDVTLLVINPCQYSVKLLLLGALKGLKKDVYFLSPVGGGSLTTRTVALNGSKLRLTSSGKIPWMRPKRMGSSGTLSIPSLTYGFVVVRYANAKACSQYY